MTIYDEIREERSRQDTKWGTKHDDNLTAYEWVDIIENYAEYAEYTKFNSEGAKYRRLMMQVAAIAVAACEAYDRKGKDGND